MKKSRGMLTILLIMAFLVPSSKKIAPDTKPLTKIQYLKPASDIIIGDNPINEVLIINTNTIVEGDIHVKNNGSLFVQNCNLTVYGDIIVEDNGTLITGYVNLTIFSEWKGHRLLDISGNAVAKFLLSNFYFNEVTNVRLEDFALMNCTGVLVFGSMHFDCGGNSTLRSESSVLNAEFVIWGGTTMIYNNSHGLMFWLSFLPWSAANLTFGANLWKTIPYMHLGAGNADFSGIYYNLTIKNCDSVAFGLIAFLLSSVNLINSTIRAFGNYFSWGSQDISGFLHNTTYLDFQPDFVNFNLHLQNSTVFTWNFYVANSSLTISDSIVGEVFAMDNSNVTLHNTTVDGNGGHTEVFKNATLECYNSTLQFLTMVHDDGYLEMYGGSLEDRVIVRDEASIYLIGTARDKINDLELLNSSSVTALEINSPVNDSHIPRVTDIKGTAYIFQGPDYVGSHTWDLSWIGPEMDWIMLNSGIGVDNGTLGVWNVTSFTVGIYSLRLSMKGFSVYREVVVQAVLPPSKAKFDVNASTIVVGQFVQFSDDTTGGNAPIVYQWDFGDASPQRPDQNPIHQYTAPGTFTVTLIVTDINNDESFYLKNITVISDLEPLASFNANTMEITAGEVVQFTDTSTGGNGELTYQWDFGDGTRNSTLQNPTHNFTLPGEYVVILTVFDIDGDFSISKPLEII